MLLDSFIRVGLNTMPIVTAAAEEILAELHPLGMGELLKMIAIAAELKDSKSVIDYAKKERYFNSAE